MHTLCLKWLTRFSLDVQYYKFQFIHWFNENTILLILLIRESETGNLKLPQKILSRHSSVSNLMVKKYEENPSTSSDVDAFDHILKVSSQHEAIMAFYYMDVNKQVC